MGSGGCINPEHNEMVFWGWTFIERNVLSYIFRTLQCKRQEITSERKYTESAYFGYIPCLHP